MAGSSLLLLIDDIAALLDDVAVMSKIAAKKTAGVLGDDLALNAQQVTGIAADRELPVIWAVAKGSFLNKLILVPAALLISFFIPILIQPLLIIGGLFLCYEGIEKIIHSLFHKEENTQRQQIRNSAAADPTIDIVSFEKEKIKGAIRTDFILSAEIIAISLGVVAQADIITQAAVLSTIAIGITIFVYGLVAGIVRLDDWGLHLHQLQGSHTLAIIQRKMGWGLLRTVPYLMKALSIFGTAAMFLVGGGIISHGVDVLHHLNERITQTIASLYLPLHNLFETITPMLFNGIIGLLAGLLVFLMVEKGIKKMISAKK